MPLRLKLLFSLAGVFVFFGIVLLVVLQVSRTSSPLLGPEQTGSVPSSTLPRQPPDPGTSVPRSESPSAARLSTDTSLPSPGAVSRPGTALVGFLPTPASVSGSVVPIPRDASDEDIRATLAPTAKMIAERFGTYSTQNGFTNLYALRPFMTSSLAKWLDSYVLQEAEKRASPPTYGATTTVALRADISSLDAARGSSTVVVETSRTDTGSTAPKTYSQNFEVKFLREGDAWKIDNVRWMR